MQINEQIQAIKGNQRLCIRQSFPEWDYGGQRNPPGQPLEWKTIGEPLNGMIPVLEEWESSRPCSQLGRHGLLGEFSKLGMRDMHPLLDTKFGEMWVDFFVEKKGRHAFGMAYAWLISRMQSITLYDHQSKSELILWNTPVEFQNSLTTSLDPLGNGRSITTYVIQPTIISHQRQSGCKLIRHAPHAWPRRIWDLCSNRVTSFQFLSQIERFYSAYSAAIWAVSHSWTSDMELTWSEVNSYEWPIPLPKGVALSKLRKQLLELGVHYCWLDVVCLRQALPARLINPVFQPVHEYPERKPLPEEQVWNVIVEQSQGSHEERILELEAWRTDWENGITEAEDRRRLEWELDVPTIGVIYRKAKFIVYYLNGLMREFEKGSLGCSLCGESYLDKNRFCLSAPLPGSALHSKDERHWFNRAWTVQEARRGRMIPGFDVKETDRGFFTTIVEPAIKNYTELLESATYRDTLDVSFLLQWMSTRASSNPVDKVAGLCSLLMVNDLNFQLPVYQAHQTPAEAWQLLVASLVAAERMRKSSPTARHLLVDWPVASVALWHPGWDFICNFPKNGAYREPHLQEQADLYIEREYLGALQKRQQNGRNSCQGVHNSNNSLELGERDAAVWTDCYIEPLSPNPLASGVYKVSGVVFDVRGKMEIQVRVKPTLPFNPWPIVPEGKYTLFLFEERNDGILCLPPCDGGQDSRKCCVKLAPLEIVDWAFDTEFKGIYWESELDDNLNGQKNIMYIR